jgi:geranylgeranyl diphosphate synthase type II
MKSHTAGYAQMSQGVQSEPVFDFDAYVSARRSLIEERLDRYLTSDKGGVLWDSMRYSVLSGGKRLRAILCLAVAEAMAGSHSRYESGPQGSLQASHESQKLDIADIIEIALPCACAIEMVHAMSLIHDDLPALDNDDLRRGKPTNHKVYGEAVALLAGDALLMLANQILIEETPRSVDSDTLLSVVSELARSTGPEGMVGGQVADMIYTGVSGRDGTGEGKDMLQRGGIATEIEEAVDDQLVLTANVMEEIHRAKTGALIRFSVWSGARLVGAPLDKLDNLALYGEVLGLAFQIADDLLDVTGDVATLGKTPGKDEAASKATFVRFFGVDGARERLKQLELTGLQLVEECCDDNLGIPALKALLQYAIHRSN